MSNPRTLRMKGPLPKLGLPVFVAWAKSQGSINDGIRVEDVDDDHVLARVLGDMTPKQAATCRREWIRVGYLIREGSLYQVPAFRKWNHDATGAERARRYRDRQRAPESGDASTVTRDVTAVTAITPTGPDRTGRSIPPHSPPTGGGNVIPRRFRGKRGKGLPGGAAPNDHEPAPWSELTDDERARWRDRADEYRDTLTPEAYQDTLESLHSRGCPWAADMMEDTP